MASTPNSTVQPQMAPLSNGAPATNTRFAFSVVTTLFFMFGFITCLNDILVPHLKALFDLDYLQASFVQLCFFGAFFLVSIPAAHLVGRIGYKGGAVVGLVLTGVGCCLFYPAAHFQTYPLFLFGLFVLASGVTVIQVAVNPYIAILGPPETSSVRLNLAQAFNSFGTFLAPLFGSVFILAVAVKSTTELSQLPTSAVAAYRASQASSVQMPYLALALVLAILAIVIAFSRLPSFKTSDSTSSFSGLARVLKNRRLLFGAGAIFCYVGAEVAIGSYLINFLGLKDIWAIPEATAGTYVSMYWGGAMIGRFIGSAVMKKVAPRNVLFFNALVAAFLVVISISTGGSVAAWSIIAVGLFNSIMFPTIFALAIESLGEDTPHGSAVLCMAIVGGAVIPVLQGMIADHTGLHGSLVLPVICYGLIGVYSRFGSSVRVARSPLSASLT